MPSTILIEQSDHIAVITFNREHAANALNRQMLSELQETLIHIQGNMEVRCVIITASGEKTFCAGADLKERKGMSDTEVKQAVGLIRETISMIECMPMPVIAALNGVAYGGGLELALACDFRVASEHAKFGLTETSLGIIPGAGGTQRLPRLIGIAKAKELIYTAKRIDAKEAESIGLISKAVRSIELFNEVNLLAQMIIGNAPIAIRQAKKAIQLGIETDLQTGLKLEELCYNETIPSKDRQEGIQAFSEKRKPHYKGE